MTWARLLDQDRPRQTHWVLGLHLSNECFARTSKVDRAKIVVPGSKSESRRDGLPAIRSVQTTTPSRIADQIPRFVMASAIAFKTDSS